MISQKRMVRIFRTRGGTEESVCAQGKLSSEQLTHLKILADGDPIIAKMSPEEGWLVLTQSHLVIEQLEEVLRIPLKDIYDVDIPRQDLLNPFIKRDGGTLDLGLRDGVSVCIKVQPGGPYFGLMNVLMRIGTGNRHRNPKPREQSEEPTTDDQPATQL